MQLSWIGPARWRIATAIPAAMMIVLATSAGAEGLKKIEKTFDNGGTLRFFGHINKGILTYDDGQVSESYGLIDNANSTSRVGLTYGLKTGEWAYLGTLEIQYAPFSTSNTSLLQPSPPSSAYEFTNANIRKIDNQFTHPRYGTFYFGQGNMASNDTAEVDLSGTTVIAYSEVRDTASGQLLRESDGTLSDIKIGDVFNNYDGLSRKVRVRYDTPLWSGFGLRSSYGRDLLSDNPEVRDQDLFDVAATYTTEFDDFKVIAQAAYSWKGSDVTIADGSASILHGPTGLSATVALGQQDNGSLTGSYGYVKLGWQADLISWGKTAFAIDYYSGTDIASAGSDSESTSFSVVQNITDWNTEVYLTWREYDYSEPETSFLAANAMFIGARFKF